jgi:hypothetical protein
MGEFSAQKKVNKAKVTSSDLKFSMGQNEMSTRENN